MFSDKELPTSEHGDSTNRQHVSERWTLGPAHPLFWMVFRDGHSFEVPSIPSNLNPGRHLMPGQDTAQATLTRLCRPRDPGPVALASTLGSSVLHSCHVSKNDLLPTVGES